MQTKLTDHKGTEELVRFYSFLKEYRQFKKHNKDCHGAQWELTQSAIKYWEKCSRKDYKLNSKIS